jgi:hypothetical protein
MWSVSAVVTRSFGATDIGRMAPNEPIAVLWAAEVPLGLGVTPRGEEAAFLLDHFTFRSRAKMTSSSRVSLGMVVTTR